MIELSNTTKCTAEIQNSRWIFYLTTPKNYTTDEFWCSHLHKIKVIVGEKLFMFIARLVLRNGEKWGCEEDIRCSYLCPSNPLLFSNRSKQINIGKIFILQTCTQWNQTTTCGHCYIIAHVAALISYSCAQNQASPITSSDFYIKLGMFMILHQQVSAEVVQPISTRGNCECPCVKVIPETKCTNSTW